MSCLLTVRAASLVLGESPTLAVFQPGPRGNQLDTKVHLQSTLYKTDTFGTSTKRPSYRESNKGSKERQGPTLGVHFTEVSVL